MRGWPTGRPPASTTGCEQPLNEVLVTGAAGKTGRAVTRALVRRGVRVRAAVRAGSRGVPYAGELVRVVTLDLVTGQGLRVAMDGVDGVYHLAPNVHPDEVRMARWVAHCAAAQGISRVAFHSVLHPEDVTMPHHLRKAEAERVIRARLATATVLRPAAYLQNLLGAARAGRIEVPHSVDVPFTNADLDDIAEVAALVLTEEGHGGESYELAGPERWSVREMAAIASEVLGTPVEAVAIPSRTWASGAGATLPEQARQDLAAMFRSYDRRGLVGDPGPLRQLLGRSRAPGGTSSSDRVRAHGPCAAFHKTRADCQHGQMSDQMWLDRAIDLAVANVEGGGGPFGAVVVRDGAVIGEGGNRVTLDLDPTAHAEVVALRNACREVGDFSLVGATVFASCEPCPLCLSASLWARVDAVVHAADRHAAADAGFDDAVFHGLLDPAPESEGHAWPMRRVQVSVDRSQDPFDAWRALASRTEY